MKKAFLILVVAVSILSTSCKDDNKGFLNVINQTSCLHNIYDGLNSNGEFLGSVGANQTSTFTIEMGGAVTFFDKSFASDPVNCNIQGLFEQQYQATIRAGETTTIIID